MLDLHIISDGEYGCHVFIRTYFGAFHYFSDRDIEFEIKDILKAVEYQGKDYQEHFKKTLNLIKDNKFED